MMMVSAHAVRPPVMTVLVRIIHRVLVTCFNSRVDPGKDLNVVLSVPNLSRSSN